MATTYVGFFAPTDGAWSEMNESFRETGAQVPEFIEKVNAFPESLPDGLKLIGSYAIQGGAQPSVMIVETEDFSGLQHINNYYNGWLQFDWHPTATGGVPRNQ